MDLADLLHVGTADADFANTLDLDHILRLEAEAIFEGRPLNEVYEGDPKLFSRGLNFFRKHLSVYMLTYPPFFLARRLGRRAKAEYCIHHAPKGTIPEELLEKYTNETTGQH